MKFLHKIILLLFMSASVMCAEEISISVVEYAGYKPRVLNDNQTSKKIAAIVADDQTRKAILKIWNEASRAFPENRRHLVGPDSGFVEITLRRGKKVITVKSWHPLFKNNPDVIVTSRGVESLGGRKRSDVQKADEAWYQNARKCFDEIIAFTASHAEQDAAEQPATAVESK